MMKMHYTMDLDDVAAEESDRMVIQPFQQEDVGPHRHNFFELAYVTGGQATHVLDERSMTVREGDYFIVDYGTIHSYTESRDFSLINCLFLPEIIDSTLKDCKAFNELMEVCLVRYYKQYFGRTAVNRIFHDEDGRILRLLLGIQEEYQEKSTGYTEIFRCHLLEILILTMRKVVREDRMQAHREPQSTVILEAIRYLETNYCSKSALGEFCHRHHYSLQYISRRFKQETGITASEYIQRKRLEKSCELLTGSDRPVQEIAHEVGYEDVKFFCQLFRRKLKMSPREYRKVAAG